jgi:hypothetical protein
MTRLATTFLLVALAVGSTALAETPTSCGQMTTRKLAFGQSRAKLAFRGTIAPGPGLPALSAPLPADLTLTLAYEPEADPANAVFTVTLPGSSFTASPGGVRYRDPSGALFGIREVVIRSASDGARKVAVKGRGTVIPATQAGTLRLVVATTGGCARSCPSTCRLVGSTTKCAKSTDTALCGMKSGCELLNLTEGPHAGRTCLLPYPSSLFLADDPGTVTGKRVAFPREALPANSTGVHIDPAAWNELDGFSPGPILTAYWPQGVDLAASNVADSEHFADSLGVASPTVLIEADSPGCVAVEHFGENDVSLDVANLPLAPPNQAFMIRPGRRLENGTRYIVALRGLIGQDAQPIQPSAAFQALRDGTPSGSAAVEARRAAFEGVFAKLQNDCGIARSTLVLAWDFTTASDDKLTRWLLHMRDETFASLGGSAAPAFVVTSIEDNPFPGDVPQRICRRVRGTYTVPLWTTFNGPGSVLNVDVLTDLPVQNGVATDIPFTASIPCSLVSPTPTPGRPIFYGHGLLGSGNEVTAGNLRTLANTYGFVMAATDWQGFANPDLGTIFGLIGDLSGFRKLPERSLQGVLNQLVLARLMKSPSGFVTDPAFIYGGTPIIDTSEVYYYGNSQGGIMGGIVMALSQEATRGVLGVPAANYSTLLHRSRDFDTYFLLLKANYPDDVQRNLTLPLIQQLWDRGEPNGWYHHTIPGDLPATPAHKVLIHMASSDDEVSNLGTEIMARSMGVPQVSPVVQSYFGIAEQAASFDGSAMVESDGGFPPEPITNIPPADNSAHGDMRARPAIQAQIDQFLRPAGSVQNFCVGPCNPE